MKRQYIFNLLLIFNVIVILPTRFSTGYTLKKFSLTRSVAKYISFRRRNLTIPKGVANIDNKVQFQLYNSLVPEGKIVEDVEDLNDLNFEQNVPTKFVTHGWLTGGNDVMCQSIKDAYLGNTKVNIFVVHWEKIAENLMYLYVVQKLPSVADYYANFLRKLIEHKELDTQNVHLIGHSLGAHLSGMVGKIMIRNHTTIGRITGLDPALPGFQLSDSFEMISTSDAALVDVIHTTAGVFGIQEPIGHIDFYPNGGISPMPGCEQSLVNDVCSHSRSWQYFVEGVFISFSAVKCENLNKTCTDGPISFGEYIQHAERGIYYFTTNRNAPFFL